MRSLKTADRVELNHEKAEHSGGVVNRTARQRSEPQLLWIALGQNTGWSVASNYLKDDVPFEP